MGWQLSPGIPGESAASLPRSSLDADTCAAGFAESLLDRHPEALHHTVTGLVVVVD